MHTHHKRSVMHTLILNNLLSCCETVIFQKFLELRERREKEVSTGSVKRTEATRKKTLRNGICTLVLNTHTRTRTHTHTHTHTYTHTHTHHGQ